MAVHICIWSTLSDGLLSVTPENIPTGIFTMSELVKFIKLYSYRDARNFNVTMTTTIMHVSELHDGILIVKMTHTHISTANVCYNGTISLQSKQMITNDANLWPHYTALRSKCAFPSLTKSWNFHFHARALHSEIIACWIKPSYFTTIGEQFYNYTPPLVGVTANHTQ